MENIKEIFRQVQDGQITMLKGSKLAGEKLRTFCTRFDQWVAYWDGYSNASETVLDTIMEWGGIDGAHHKQWLLDLIVRKITDHDSSLKKYSDWVNEYEDGEDGPQTYEWDRGIAP